MALYRKRCVCQNFGDVRDFPYKQERDDLVRLATFSGAEVDVVGGHTILQQRGGAGALLRYRPMWG